MYSELLRPFTAKCDLVDGLDIIANRTEQNFTRLELGGFCSCRLEYLS